MRLVALVRVPAVQSVAVALLVLAGCKRELPPQPVPPRPAVQVQPRPAPVPWPPDAAVPDALPPSAVPLGESLAIAFGGHPPALPARAGPRIAILRVEDVVYEPQRSWIETYELGHDLPTS
jgi:hypothetical protein